MDAQIAFVAGRSIYSRWGPWILLTSDACEACSPLPVPVGVCTQTQAVLCRMREGAGENCYLTCRETLKIQMQGQVLLSLQSLRVLQMISVGTQLNLYRRKVWSINRPKKTWSEEGKQGPILHFARLNFFFFKSVFFCSDLLVPFLFWGWGESIVFILF